MRTSEDVERELIATVRDLLAQPGKMEADSGDAVTSPADSGSSPPPGQKSGEEESQEDVTEQSEESARAGEDEGEADEPAPAASAKKRGFRSAFDSVLGTGTGEQRSSDVQSKVQNDDPVKSFLARLEKKDAKRVEAVAEEPVSLPVEETGADQVQSSAPASAPPESQGFMSLIKGRGEVEVPEPEEVADAGVVSVDELGNLADLILPKSATFTIEELSINRQEHHFDFVDNARVVSEFDDLFAQAFSPATLAEAAAQVVVPTEEVRPSRRSLFKKIHLPKPGAGVEEYNPTVHGPLVDLVMRPLPNIEEIELYPVNEPYAYIRVTYDSSTHEYTYNVLEPVLTPAEQELFGEIKERLFESLDISTREITRVTARTALRDSVNLIIADYGIQMAPLEREKVLYHVEKEFLGDGLVDPIMHDKYIEDISCDGVNSVIFVYHTTYESMKTNLAYHEAPQLDSFVTKLAQRAGKYISIAEPMLDATMNDGSRIQMTLGDEVTAHGSTFTIRKFREEPITPTDLIEWHTFSPLGIAFLWLAVENSKSCIFAGGTASGKTTTLNAISLFIPPLAKIVTLEDTRELKLPHSNWIPSITRDSFSHEGRGEIDMYELLRAALRQRPEYLLVGEVRGREALTLFQAMSTGHVTYATMHADSVASAVHRLENPPINVPRNMLSALNLVSIQVQARVGGQRIRRNKQLIEILDIDPRTNELITNEVFRWHPATDEIRYSGKSYILEQIMEDRGWSEERMREELKRRQEVLEWMRLKKIRHYKDVSKILISYYRDPETVIQRVRADLYE
jgi:flagellar protein FlaI